MTIATLPSSSSPIRTIVPTTTPARASIENNTVDSIPPLHISDSWLLGWALTRSGFPAAVAIGNDATPLHPAQQKLPFAIHLTRPLPVTALLRALAALKGRNPVAAVLLMLDEPGTESYREHLHLDKDLHVLGIRRKFWKHGDHKQRPRVAGIAWRTAGYFHDVPAPLAAPHGTAALNTGCWRTIRALLQCGANAATEGVIRQVTLPAPPTHNPTDFRCDLITHLPPASLRALAADLDYRAVRDFCFAHPHAAIPDDALLRGPLFIDGDALITPDHIHIGPGWVTRFSPPLTLPATGDEEDPSRPALISTLHRGSARDYFTGPKTGQRPAYDFFKRAFDIAFALTALTITLPICLAVALIIKAYDRGPIFFIHRREGRDGRPFGCMKFRTMVRNAEALKSKLRAASQVDGPQFKMANDPRITPIGRFLRKSNIDELPQFLNVIKGTMSVVGPRPSPFEENQLCPGWRDARLSIKPGITGLWQISRSRNRGAADFQEWIFYDTQYVDRRSFWLDMRIVLLTIKELFGQGQ